MLAVNAVIEPAAGFNSAHQTYLSVSWENYVLHENFDKQDSMKREKAYTVSNVGF
jgi:hypothetical protein